MGRETLRRELHVPEGLRRELQRREEELRRELQWREEVLRRELQKREEVLRRELQWREGVQMGGMPRRTMQGAD